MLTSLVVLVILGVVLAQITRWVLASSQPATPTGQSHRAGGTRRRVLQAARRSRQARPAPPSPGGHSGAAAPPGSGVDGARTPWWQRVRAVAGLGLVVAILGAALALAVAAAALAVVALLDRALG